jgi:hypothetical protein
MNFAYTNYGFLINVINDHNEYPKADAIVVVESNASRSDGSKSVSKIATLTAYICIAKDPFGDQSDITLYHIPQDGTGMITQDGDERMARLIRHYVNSLLVARGDSPYWVSSVRFTNNISIFRGKYTF